jgi:hypothetical protein
MATTTPNFGWPVPTSTDLVKDGATAIEALGDSIDASLLDLKGGTSGQVLSKNSNTDMDFIWVTSDDANAIQNTIVDAKGDLIAATAADTPARLAVGTNGHVLTADSTAATGIKWAAPAGGGKVLQVVSATNTATQSTSSGSFVDAITVSITPTSATSKVLVMAYISGSSDISVTQIAFRLARGGTGIFVGDASGSRTQATGVLFNPSNANYSSQAEASFLDSPATTSATTYAMQYKTDGAGTAYLGRTFNDVNASFTVRTPSAGIIVMEIGA